VKRRSERRLSPEEAELWSHVARSVRAFPGRFAPPPAPKAPPAAETEPVAKVSGPVEGKPARPALKPIVPLDRRMLTALKRGAQPLEAVLDLHGLRQDDAHQRLVGFLRRAQADGARTVLVITGKGAAGAADQGGDPWSERGVLRRVVPHWLRLPDLRAVVLGFEEASLGHGGSGALYVRLRRAATPAERWP
jgi:DNA-nicking Smr family endonuclease